MKKILMALVVVIVLVWLALSFLKRGESVGMVEDLPWNVGAVDASSTQVLGVNVGQDRLSDVVKVFKKIPEIAIFQTKEKERTAEAFFSQVSLGFLKANIIAELDIEGVDLSAYAKFDRPGDAMPSGQRKYDVSLTGIKETNKLRVWKLAYIPVVNYSEEQLLKFFSVPEKKITISNVSWLWLYPEKSLVVSYNIEGKEVFYYTSSQEYGRLLSELSEGNK